MSSSAIALPLPWLVVAARALRAFEAFHALRELAKTPHLRCDPLPVAVRQRGKRASVYPRFADRIVDLGRGRDHGAVGNFEVTADHRGAADAAVRADARRARDADAAGDRRVRADHAVVADLDLVVELGALLDHRVVDRAAVDRRVGADLDVVTDHDAPELRDLAPAACVV